MMSNRKGGFLGKLAILAVLLMIPVMASAGGQKPPAQHSAPPSHSAPPPSHSAPPPAQHNAPHPPGPSNQSHGPSGQPGGGSHNNNATNNNQHGNQGGSAGSNNSRGGGAGRGSNTATGGNNNAKGGNNAGGNNAKGGNNAGGNNAKGGNNAGGANNARGGNAGKGGNTPGGANAKGGQAGHGPNNAGGQNNARGGQGGQAKASANQGHGPQAAHRQGPPTQTKQVHTRSGQNASVVSRGGHVRTIQTKNTRIEHGLHGQRRVVMTRNGRTIVAMGRGRGYAQRAYFNRGGRAYYQRTYYYGGRRYAYAYRGYYYGGYPYYGYAPAYYYRPAYYGWAYNPWPQPAYYNWGWQGQPWYGYYGNYYQPYPSYPSGSSWLTDWMVAKNLQDAYEARGGAHNLVPPGFASSEAVASLWTSDSLVAASLAPSSLLYAMPAGAKNTSASASGGGNGAMPADVKQALSEEIKQRMAAEQASAGSSNNTQQASSSASSGGDQSLPALDPKYHLFIVSSNLTVTSNDDQECELNPGDVISRTEDTPGDDNKVAILVKSAQKDDCPVGTNTAVELNDLQEMDNHLREQLDAGLKELADKQGKDGLPKAPDTTTTAGEVPAPTADNGVDNDLNEAQKDADQTEADVNQSQ